MPRIAPVDAGAATGDARRALDALPAKINVFRTIAHAEASLLPLLQYANAVLFKQSLGARERELVTLATVQEEGGAYEWSLHLDIAQTEGVSAGQIAAIERGDLEGPEFDAADRALLQFTASVVRDVRVEQAVFDAVCAHLSEREIVETILVIGFYLTLARVTEVLEVDLEASAPDLAEAATFEARLLETGSI
jgi:alkylhydroperoxidase family enzyme